VPGGLPTGVELRGDADSSILSGEALDFVADLQRVFGGRREELLAARAARQERLLAGELPYNPDIRVWTDVNLPPITLLVLFAPFSAFDDLGGKLAYFLLNHAAFLAALGVLLVVSRPPARRADPLLWGSAVDAMAPPSTAPVRKAASYAR